MADANYSGQAKVYVEQGAARQVIASGGSLDVESGGELDIESGAAIKIAGTAVTSTAAELNNVADVSARVQEITATGGVAVTAGVQSVELNHVSSAVIGTIADAANHQGLFHVKDTSASGTAAHKLNLTSGTFDGSNTIATFNAPNECLVVYFDSAGNGTVVENVGTVVLSTM